MKKNHVCGGELKHFFNSGFDCGGNYVISGIINKIISHYIHGIAVRTVV